MNVKNPLFADLRYIVTHPGKAHFDDFTAVALTLAQHGSYLPVFRRNPDEAELADPKVAVLDIGMRLEPENFNFDHHQLARDAEPACAFSMMIDAGYVPENVGRGGWVHPRTVIDAKGANYLADQLGTTDKVVVTLLSSPIERWLLSQFADTDPGMGGLVDNDTADMAFQYGCSLLEHAARQQEGLTRLQETVDVGWCGGVRYLVYDKGTDITGMSALQQEYSHGAKPGDGDYIAGLICPDERGPGWMLYRYGDDPRVDLSKLATEKYEKLIHFAHTGGFIAKTVELDRVDAVRLFREAITQ